MSNVAVRVRDLGKRYRIGALQKKPTTTLQAVKEAALAPFDYLRTTLRPPTEEETLWALRDITFDVEHGEVVGIIGRNGAGKSTLLKILSRITEPTEGYAEMDGRVGALIEVGTGFHDELTGRENVYMNGSILGMTGSEIERKFDEIVEFAGVERFIDTPVKRYSSGMKVRLGFAVAAHMEPEILIVDEVLAVGDINFQKKCLGKIGDVASGGRTVLFVSHNMATIQALCERVILLDSGHILTEGLPNYVINEYVSMESNNAEATFEDVGASADYKRIRLMNQEGMVTDQFLMGQDILVEMEFYARMLIQEPGFGVVITGPMGEHILRVTSRETHGNMPPLEEGGHIRLCIKAPNLMPGTYTILAGINNAGSQIVLHKDILRFSVNPTAIYPTGKIPDSGIIYTECEWDAQYS